ncbi:DUF3137 domain-containing protein [Chryseobacterium koreense]|uniref:DUF3137 domain-containing protein n=1 Tax=Chryseobacterium koreense TaxID=232216 RepID=UPI0026E9D7CD|nr:DUF3137 domain-containing protein [Chryseobacterium koreense]
MVFSETIQQEIQQNFIESRDSELSDLERLRKETALKAGAVLAFWGLLILFVLIFLTWKTAEITFQEFQIRENDSDIILAGVGFLLFLYLMAFIIFFNIKKKNIFHRYLYTGKYAAEYRKEIKKKIIPYLKGSMTFHPEQGISRADFTESGFPMFDRPKRYYSSGATTGEIGKTTFTFAEVLAEDLQESYHHFFGSAQYTDLFRGVFFVADFNKNTDWNTLVYPDGYKYISTLLFIETEEKYERIKLEDVEFERYFEVYGTDQVESRYVLSQALMARMVDFKKKSKKNIQFSFKDSKVYFGIHYPKGKDLFTPPLFRSVHNFKAMENYISDIQMMLDIIEELNLNSRLTFKS